MKKKKILALLMTMIMLIGLLSACSSGGGENSNGSDTSDKTTETTTEAAGQEINTEDSGNETSEEAGVAEFSTRADYSIYKDKFKGETLTVWAWWDITEPEKEAWEQFEELTGAKMDWVVIGWSEYTEKLISSVSAGTGPDICFFGAEAIPTYVKKNIILPVSDYVHFDRPAFTTYSPQAERIIDYFTMDGKIYAIADQGPSSYKLYYRKDLLENAGLEDPYDLFVNGEWTWDKWFELMEDVIQDLDGDGEIDVWGFDAWMGVTPFVYTNGADYVIDGKFAVNTPEFIEALEYYKKLKQPNYVWKPWEDGKDPQINLIAGATVFNYWGAWEFENLRQNIGDNLGFVPFPKGPSATSDMADYYNPTVTGLAASCKNPELAGVWLEYVRVPESLEAWEENKEKQRQNDIATYGSEELVDLAYDMGANGVIDASVSYPGLSSVIDSIINDQEKSVTQAANEYLASGQAIIDEVLKGTESNTETSGD